jgi:hypothetical protein
MASEQEGDEMQWRVKLPAWALMGGLLAVALAGACGGGEGETSAAPSPYTPVEPGEAAIDVVVVVEQHNNPTFDLRAQEINGVTIADQFDQDSSNNLEEPLVIPPGRIRFFLDNRGTLAHAFEVRLPDGSTVDKTRNVGPRKTDELMVDLEPGTYLVLCQLSDHAARGSQRTLIVDAASQYPDPPFLSQ